MLNMMDIMLKMVAFMLKLMAFMLKMMDFMLKLMAFMLKLMAFIRPHTLPTGHKLLCYPLQHSVGFIHGEALGLA